MTHSIIYIISAPSGTGKSTLITQLIQKKMLTYNIQHSISFTTRNARPTEKNGQHYHFITLNLFKKMISENIFFEYTKIFDHYYGTSKKKIEDMLNLGTDIILDIDWKGAVQIKNKIPEAKSILLLPPSIHELKRRLYKRGLDPKKNILKRMKQVKNEIKHYKEYDYIIINDDINITLLHLQSIIISEKLRYTNQTIYFKQKIQQLSLEIIKEKKHL